MSGIPSHSIRALWNMANFCIDHHCTPNEYWKQSYRDTQAIMVINESRIRKQNQENNND